MVFESKENGVRVTVMVLECDGYGVGEHRFRLRLSRNTARRASMDVMAMSCGDCVSWGVRE
jgi:hypothetical protein